MKKISLSVEEQFNQNNYPSEGVYHNTETNEIVICNYRAGFVLFIGPYGLWNHIFESTVSGETLSTGMVSESFALKALALLSVSSKLKDYEI